MATRVNLFPVIKSNGNVYVVTDTKYLMRISSEPGEKYLLVMYDLKLKNTIMASKVLSADITLEETERKMIVNDTRPVKLSMKDVTLTKEFAGKVKEFMYVLQMYETLGAEDPIDETKPLKLAIRDKKRGHVFAKTTTSEDGRINLVRVDNGAQLTHW
jgi:hypothetical protein